jgi:hypothetical protein
MGIPSEYAKLCRGDAEFYLMAVHRARWWSCREGIHIKVVVDSIRVADFLAAMTYEREVDFNRLTDRLHVNLVATGRLTETEAP